MKAPINFELIFLALSVLAELLVALVIYYEWEGGRLDEFLADADRLVQERNKIYTAYCALTVSDGNKRNQVFRDYLDRPDSDGLREACHNNIRLLSRIGARLPRFWGLRKTALEWHVAAFLWVILGPYIEDKRKESGPSFAKSFLEYALASTNSLLKQERDSWTIRDPDRSRKQDVIVSRDEFLQIRMDLRLSIKRRN